MSLRYIDIKGARQHNLKNIHVRIPRDQLVVITGLSGSGKSTLAFDTLYAEGQRRYVESLSAYARQFLEKLDKPDVDLIDGLSPAIAIEQKSTSKNPRSTVATVTEIHDYLRLLFSRIGIAHCHICGKPIVSQTLDQIVDQILALDEKTRIIILAPVVKAQQGSHGRLLNRLKKDGFARVRINGDIISLDQVGKLDPKTSYDIEVVVDRLVVKPSIRNRLADSLELALGLSNPGTIEVLIVDNSGASSNDSIIFSASASCARCGVSYGKLTPASFSFNSPQGACKRCSGLGVTKNVDPDRIVPNPELSLREGAVATWGRQMRLYFTEFLEALTAHYGVDIYTPYKDLPDTFKQVILYGSGDEQIGFYHEENGRKKVMPRPFIGVIPLLEARYNETTSSAIRQDIEPYMAYKPCSECNGQRLNPISRCVRVGGTTLPEILALSISQAHDVIQALPKKLDQKENTIAGPILKVIQDRLSFLENVGLAYLTLDRQASTLSGGESQRIRLATQIGSKLIGVMYVLDEPSIGLHQRDHHRLLETLFHLRDIGNTVIVVEHDEETIRSADYIVDMGPGAGVHGGEVVFSGTPDALVRNEQSLTGLYLAGKRSIDIPNQRRAGNGKFIRIQGARANNLKSIDVAFPLGCFICVTGVSGSGKSTLVLETLYPALSRQINKSHIQAGAHSKITGRSYINKVINIDQSPIGRTPRSNPATYTGLFTPIRDLFSKTPEAKVRGYKPGRFSFNVYGGRCEACMGDGTLRIGMHFLPDVYVTCDVCHGKRYNRETLEIRYKGKNIAEVLDMTVNQALAFFRNISSIREKLQTLVDVGLGYIRLGQSALTFSGGEAQRIKLSKELSKRSTGRTLYILDEPTTGLHMDDINKLLTVLNRLVDMGNTVMVIEHNMDVIKVADYIVDLGPEGGDQGGQVVACGTPEQVCQVTQSYTGSYLKRLLARNGAGRNDL